MREERVSTCGVFVSAKNVDYSKVLLVVCGLRFAYALIRLLCGRKGAYTRCIGTYSGRWSAIHVPFLFLLALSRFQPVRGCCSCLSKATTSANTYQ